MSLKINGAAKQHLSDRIALQHPITALSTRRAVRSGIDMARELFYEASRGMRWRVVCEYFLQRLGCKKLKG
ncbi:hypothetical protein BSU04_09365 [Caballeronia sordidicola]|jgi:hypothetical protein|uniref:Uncharacterized protein n=1 Tax=Caballeronia sordidicola TaxID=196367 RepID=A0A226X5W4_CABSO|nr:hypothetical protein BSU04_09365 [Caballeronia sordidicola]